jgi:O-antigen/teichoic acid export membrane protein
MSTMLPSRYKFYAHVAGNTGYLIMGLAVSSAALFGFDVFLGRFLTKSNLGLVTYAVCVTNIFLILSDLGLSQAMPAQLAAALAAGDTGRTNRLVGNALWLQLVAALLGGGLLLGASYVVGGEDSEVGPWIRVLALWLVTLPFVRLMSAVYEGYQRMPYSFLATLLREPLRLVLLVAVFFGFMAGPQTAIQVFAGSAVVILAANLVVLKVFLSRTPQLHFWPVLKGSGDLLKTSFYFYLPLISLWVYPELVKVLTGKCDTPEALARLRVCVSLSTVVFVVLAALPRALLPAFSSKAKDLLVVRASFLGLLKYGGFINFVAFALIAGVGPYLAPLIYGPQYPQESIRQLLILVALGSFFDVYRLLSDPILQGTGNFRVTGVVETVRLAAFVALALIVIPRWPGLGVGAAYATVALLAWLVRLIWIDRRIVYLPWFSLLVTVALALGMAASGFFQQPLLFWILAAAAVIFQAAQFSRIEFDTIRQTLKAFLKRS